MVRIEAFTKGRHIGPHFVNPHLIHAGRLIKLVLKRHDFTPVRFGVGILWKRIGVRDVLSNHPKPLALDPHAGARNTHGANNVVQNLAPIGVSLNPRLAPERRADHAEMLFVQACGHFKIGAGLADLRHLFFQHDGVTRRRCLERFILVFGIITYALQAARLMF